MNVPWQEKNEDDCNKEAIVTEKIPQLSCAQWVILPDNWSENEMLYGEMDL